MATEREKMTNGEPFLTNNPQLMKDKATARQLTSKYNNSPEDEVIRKNMLELLFGHCGDKVFIKPPSIATMGIIFSWAKTFF